MEPTALLDELLERRRIVVTAPTAFEARQDMLPMLCASADARVIEL